MSDKQITKGCKCFFCKNKVYLIKTKDRLIEQCPNCGALRIKKEAKTVKS